MLELELDGVMLTGLEGNTESVALRRLNPTDSARTVHIGSSLLKLVSAHKTDLAGKPSEGLPLVGGEIQLEVGPRAWVGVQLTTQV